MSREILLAFAWLILASQAARAQDRPDVIVAEFEGANYHPWVAQGEAFGKGPAAGTLHGQMTVEGFEGMGLVSSFVGGDDASGTLTSPPFVVERPFLNFLIGGGKFTGETCFDLLVDDKLARTGTGPNDSPGGSERLDWASWDVADLMGKSVVLRVVDHRQGSWGHISVDQVVQSDRRRGIVPTIREVVVGSRFLQLPVSSKVPTRRVRILTDGRLEREFDIRLADGLPDFTTFLDLADFQGKRIRIEADLAGGSKSLEAISQADTAVDPSRIYREKGRPRFHFTSRRGWLNDPNGLVFCEGEYHLFYQHNPYGWDWGNMHWGHAVSPDLVRWTELPIALTPRVYGDWAFSGSAVVDTKNSSGFGSATTPPLVGAYTSTGRGECLIYSLDRGRTWAEYSANPVLRHAGRDPRLLWHGPSKRWVMAVYDEEAGRRDIAFHSSLDLKSWKLESRIAGFFECPDLFELAVEGEPAEKFWVLSAADGSYLLGTFDGRAFLPEPGGKHQTWHGDFYAAQIFSNEPKGRRVQIGWARDINFPGEPFNQQMTVASELTLRRTPDGLRMFAYPVAELATLRSATRSWVDLTADRDDSLVLAQSVGGLDIRLEAEVGISGNFDLRVGGATIAYDVARKVLSCSGVSAPIDPAGGLIKLRVLVDRGSLEVFGNEGQVAISRGLASKSSAPIGRFATLSGQATRFRRIEVSELNSAWPEAR